MEVNTMIYTEEDLEQAYAIGYNEAVDDVNEYIDQESMEFSLDESYDDDYSAVEDMVCNENSRWRKREHTLAAIRRSNALDKKLMDNVELPTKKEAKHFYALNREIDRRFDNRNRQTRQMNLHVKDPTVHFDTERQEQLKAALKRNRLKNSGLALRGDR